MDNEKREFDNTDIQETPDASVIPEETAEVVEEVAENVYDLETDYENNVSETVENSDELPCECCSEHPDADVFVSAEETEEFVSEKKNKNKVIAIIAGIVAVLLIAGVVYSICMMNGVGSKTIVNTKMPAQYSAAGEKLENKEYDIKFENPVASLAEGEKASAMSVNGYSMSQSLFNYFAKTNALNYVANLYQSGEKIDFKNFDWNTVDEETGLKLSEIVKGQTVESIAAPVAIVEEAVKRGVALTEEDEKNLTSWLEQTKTQLGENFEKALKSSGYDSEEQLIESQRFNLLYQKAYEAFSNEPMSYVEQYEDYKKYLSDDKITVQHVLIQFPEGVTRESTDEEKSETRKKAEEVLSKAKSGEDFNSLVDTYSEDPGKSKNGYTFANDGSMVQEFTDASFALEIGAVSELVETDYGYHIIKRMDRIPSADEYFAMVEDNMKIRLNKFTYSDISFETDLTPYFGDPEAEAAAQAEAAKTEESENAEATAE